MTDTAICNECSHCVTSDVTGYYVCALNKNRCVDEYVFEGLWPEWCPLLKVEEDDE